MKPTKCSCHLADEQELEKWYSDYYSLLCALVDAIQELQDLVMTLRKEVDAWHPDKPYKHELYCDINVCFDDYRIAREYPELFFHLS